MNTFKIIILMISRKYIVEKKNFRIFLFKANDIFHRKKKEQIFFIHELEMISNIKKTD